MRFYIPWINSRRRFIFAVFVDLLINFLFYSFEYSRQFNFYPNFIVPLCLGLFWVILSYVFGRYVMPPMVSDKKYSIKVNLYSSFRRDN